MEHAQLWFTRLLNEYAAGPANALLGLAGVHAHDPAHPWQDFIAMQILVALIILALFAVLKSRLLCFYAVDDGLRTRGHRLLGFTGHRALSFSA